MFLQEQEDRAPACAPTLPRKLSALLRIAVNDAQAAERSGVTLNMRVWVEAYEDRCSVCMAGAVMISRLGYSRKVNSFPGDPHRPFADAIDSMRCGFFASAAGFLNIHIPNGVKKRVEELKAIVHDDFDSGEVRRASWDTYLAVATELERIGL